MKQQQMYFWFIMLICIMMIAPIGAIANTINIPDDFETIQAGIDAAENDEDTVLVDPGEYFENLQIIEKPIFIASRFLTTHDSDFINTTKINGNQNGSTIKIQNVDPRDGIVSIVGFTITNGSGEIYFNDIVGGGISCNESALQVEHCKIIENSLATIDHADNGKGAGIWIYRQSPVQITDCVIADNTCDTWNGEGAGLFCYFSDVTISNTIFEGNNAGHFGKGGGASFDYFRCQGTLSNCYFRNNLAESTGAAIYVSNRYNLTVVNSEITNNHADRYCGGICNDNAILHIENSIVESNHGTQATVFSTDSTTIRNTRIIDNTGGGVTNWGGVIFMENSLIANNQGHGVLCYGTRPGTTINNCSIVFNPDEECGGVIFEEFHTLILNNSILFGNTPQNFLYRDINGQVPRHGLIDLGFSVIDTASFEVGEQTDIIYRENIIFNEPHFVDADNGDYHITVDSPCLDAGDPESALDPDGTRADMGAFYFHQRDIAVDPTELHFEPIGWGERASQQVEIRNEGGTTLHILEIPFPLGFSSITFFPLGIFDPPIEIAPDSVFILTATFEPNPEVPNVASCEIISDDPDEEIVSIEATGEVSGVNDELKHPASFSLSSPYPNPFNSTTTIGYSLPVAGNVSLAVYDLSGREVARLVEGAQPAGTHETVWHADGVSTGIYLVRLENNNSQFTQKILLVK